jgi:hypothetical protein
VDEGGVLVELSEFLEASVVGGLGKDNKKGGNGHLN